MQQLSLNIADPLVARAALFLSTHGEPYTTSRAVAERFRKHHKDVIRAIEKLLQHIPNSEFGQRNFAPTYFIDQWNRSKPEYHLTHDGFALLSMRFTGREALAWQVAFLEAFNALEAELQARTARYAAALDQVRPCLRPIVEATEAGDSRQAIGICVGKSPASITYHRRQARRLGLLNR